MKITLLGHASLLVEGEGATLLMDPVFFDPFENELTVSCPAREVFPEKLPPIDGVILSHGHADHFDQRSMMELPRNITVYLPRDPELASALGALGFSRLQPMEPGVPFKVGGLQILPTGSRDDDEVGAVFSDSTGSSWNQVDTATDHTMARNVFEHLGKPLDVVLCPFNPILEYGELWTSEEAFPTERYERLLEAAISSHAHTIVPSSSGQRLEGRMEWANPRTFPVSRERFIQDLQQVAPELAGLLLNPGEGIELNDGTVKTITSPCARTLQDDTHRIHFDPVAHPAPPLVDTNPLQFSEEAMAATLAHVMEEVLPTQLNAQLTPRLTGPLRTLWDRRASLQLEVVFPGSEQRWHVSSWSPRATLQAGAHSDPDYAFRYIASEIYGHLQGRFNIQEQGSLRARRRAPSAPNAGEAFRFSSLDPARLFGEDLYNVVDATFFWHPLHLL
jgi:L-ascorbate metabolism protein UlaG (beta-lactamase superfamily)